MAQLELFPSMPAGRCPLCRSVRPQLATCAKCALRRAALHAAAPWLAERDGGRRAVIAAAAARELADRPRRARLDRLAALGRSVKVALVGCGARKLPGRHPARSLYTGSLFRAALAHAERTADEVLILSALHGVVAPNDELEAYDVRLESYRRHERELWAHRVMMALGALYPGLHVELTVYAGATYADAFEWGLQWRGASCGFRLVNYRLPLGRLQVGERLAWFKRERGRLAPPLPPHVCKACRRILLQDWERAAGGVCSVCVGRRREREKRNEERRAERARERERERLRWRSAAATVAQLDAGAQVQP